MKSNFLKKITSAACALILTMGSTSFIDDLNQGIKDPQTNTVLDPTGLLAKVYASLSITGQVGSDGNPDMSQFDEGNSAFYRRIFEANELCSDECIWTWQGDAGIPELTNLSWDSSHGYNELTYYRIMYNVTLCNYYLAETADTEDQEVLTYRAEVRFMRAFYLFQFIDLYGRAPYKEVVDETLPNELSRKEAFDKAVSELKAITGESGDSREVLLDYAGDDNNYGRADKVAAYLLLARLYLNAEVYTGTAMWNEAVAYANKAIDSPYKVNFTAKGDYTAYQQLFMGDNGENPNARQEIVFPIRCDGATSRSYGGAIYPIASATGSGTPDCGLASSQWTCNRARQALVLKFFETEAQVPMGKDNIKDVYTAAGDDRAMFFTGGEGDEARTFSTEEKTTFIAGLGILKWSNLYSDGGTPKDVTFPDTDIPLFRLAEAYLTRAEANYRLGVADAINDINYIRSRAHAKPLESLKETDIIDEWCREFYFEGRRRSDLIRFGYFTSGKYLWDWKGGTYQGNGVLEMFNLYPIPYNELKSNPNMHQNTGF